MRRLPALLISLAALLGACDAAQSGAPAAPPKAEVAGIALPLQRVVDRADLLSPAVEQIVVDRLEALERRTGDQLVVVTLPSLGGEPIEAVGRRLGNMWGVGQADTDNGVLLVVAPTEHMVRIEAGRGLAARLSDARAKEIVDNDLLPHFRRNEMENGIVAGVDAIDRRLSETAAAAPSGRVG